MFTLLISYPLLCGIPSPNISAGWSPDSEKMPCSNNNYTPVFQPLTVRVSSTLSDHIGMRAAYVESTLHELPREAESLT